MRDALPLTVKEAAQEGELQGVRHDVRRAWKFVSLEQVLKMGYALILELLRHQAKHSQGRRTQTCCSHSTISISFQSKVLYIVIMTDLEAPCAPDLPVNRSPASSLPCASTSWSA